MSRWKVHKDAKIYFTTSTIVQWMPIFTDRQFFNIILESLKFCLREKGLRIHGYVIMLNHIHLLSTVEGNTSDIMRDLKTFTSSQIIKLLKKKNLNLPLKVFENAAKQNNKSQNFKVWQSGFHPIGIESEKFYIQKLDYIHQNPVRKGYVAKPEHWVYSSARNYAGFTDCVLEIDML